MTGYCPDCGNTLCICEAIDKVRRANAMPPRRQAYKRPSAWSELSALSLRAWCLLGALNIAGGFVWGFVKAALR